jgi:hypothetical protein
MNTYKRYRFPPGIISYAVWLYYRFNLSHRDIEDLLAERAISTATPINGIDSAGIAAMLFAATRLVLVVRRVPNFLVAALRLISATLIQVVDS